MKTRLPTTVALLFCAGIAASFAPHSLAAQPDPVLDADGDTDGHDAAKPGSPDRSASAVAAMATLADPKAQLDFPAMALAADGTPWIALIAHDGTADTLKLARKITGPNGDTLETVADISTPGIVHQPAIAVAKDGTVWCFWGQVDARDIVTLRARPFANGKAGDEITLASSGGSDTFADAGTDRAGRVWVAWQSMRRGQGDIFARWLDPATGRWSPEMLVSQAAKPGEEGGDWEPRLAFDDADGAFIAFDSSRGKREFNLFLARVGLDGKSVRTQLTDSPEYEAHARIATAKDGKSLWIAAERGHRDWGMPTRNDGGMALNAQKRLLFGRFDIGAGAFTEIPVPGAGKFLPPDFHGNGHGSPVEIVNLPCVAVGADGLPCLAWRSYASADHHWTVRAARFDPTVGQWTQARSVPDSAFCQDRHLAMATGADGLLLCLPSDGRRLNESLRAHVALMRLLPDFGPAKVAGPATPALSGSQPYLRQPSPDRPLADHHVWEVGGKKYHLVFGDLHRHSDFSNCATSIDTSLNEHYRYACDIAGLDFMGMSDHTDIGKVYTPYEWWQTQKAADVFFVPGRFMSLYSYEREQLWPWGHRNVVFPQRGAPVVYIQRAHWLASPWAHFMPGKGATEITPMELWDVLEAYGKPVAVISHCGATGMGTDWDRYQGKGGIDNKVENSVEIFQGDRVSYEGRGAPQPTIGFRKGGSYAADTGTNAPVPKIPQPIMDFGKTANGQNRNNGTYQHALSDGYKLGVFASSDHVATHTAFGGVYVEEDTRLGIITGLRLRHSIAATDKIFVEFSCDGHPMGEVFTCAGKPVVALAVEGTAPIFRVTLVRNEKNYQVWEGDALKAGGAESAKFAASFTDPEPLKGENRYYLRVEQADGSMAWSSPVWATVK